MSNTWNAGHDQAPEQADPLDALLAATFGQAADKLADDLQSRGLDLAERVMTGIRRRQRRRLLVMSLLSCLGSVCAMVFVLPLLGTLADSLSTDNLSTALSGWNSDGPALISILVAALAAAWLYLLAEDPI